MKPSNNVYIDEATSDFCLKIPTYLLSKKKKTDIFIDFSKTNTLSIINIYPFSIVIPLILIWAKWKKLQKLQFLMGQPNWARKLRNWNRSRKEYVKENAGLVKTDNLL